MSRLSLSELASIAEIIGAVAVVISLIYVAQSLRDNTAAVQSASVLELANASREGLLAIASDPDLARIRMEGDRDPGSLEEVDALRYFLFYRQLWISFQNAWVQWGLGAVEDEIWAGYNTGMCGIISVPGPSQEWPRHAPVLHPGFVRLVESCQGEADGFAEIVNRAAQNEDQ